MTDQRLQWDDRTQVRMAMLDLLSDNHNYDRGLEVVRVLVDQIRATSGVDGLVGFSATLSVELATAIERIAEDQGLPASALAEVWFAE